MGEFAGFPVVFRLGVLSDDMNYRLRLTEGLGKRSSVSLTVVKEADLPSLGATNAVEVLLLDIENRVNREIRSVLESIARHSPRIKIMLIGDTLSDEVLAFSILHNVCGILPKASACETYLKAMVSVLSGEIWLERRKLTSLLNYTMYKRTIYKQAPHVTSCLADIGKILTERELEIVELVADGLSNKEIAKIVTLSPVTVKTHLRNIFQKLHINSRVELILHRSRT
jgi:DNA-binding NarL/FixJ family response regulator